MWGRIDFRMSGPKVMFGTKCPSITSQWIQSAPASSIARTSSPSFEKSAERMEGAIRMGRVMAGGLASPNACRNRETGWPGSVMLGLDPSIS
ncbi:hypothetical protein D3C87_1827520 [compost metagenome]